MSQERELEQKDLETETDVGAMIFGFIELIMALLYSLQ